MALETCSARAKRPLPEGEWKSLEIGSQFISFIQVPDWLIAAKFQRWRRRNQEGSKSLQQGENKIFTSVLDSLDILHMIIECLIICVAYEVSVHVFE